VPGATNFKFGIQTDRNNYYPKNVKLCQMGRELGHVGCTYGILGPPLKWLKLQTLNLASRLTKTSTIQNAKFG